MYTSHLPKQREIHVLPCYEQLAESELDVIAHQNNLDKYTVEEHQNFKIVDRNFIFEYYSYTFKY